MKKIFSDNFLVFDLEKNMCIIKLISYERIS